MAQDSPWPRAMAVSQKSTAHNYHHVGLPIDESALMQFNLKLNSNLLDSYASVAVKKRRKVVT